MNDDRKANLALVDPDERYRDEFLVMAAENAAAGDGHYSADYETALRHARDDFAGYVEMLRGQSQGLHLTEAHVPQNTFWLLRRHDSRLLGASRLRHRLTQELEIEGGHIGYDIRASERRKGYGSQILALTLAKARQHGFSRVLIMCSTANVGSARIIERNGGVFQDEVTSPNGTTLSRYWIDVPSHDL